MSLRLIILICFISCANVAWHNTIFAAKVLTTEPQVENTISNQLYYKQFQDVFERIDRDYVQEPDKQKMTDTAINEMLKSLDPHSSYYADKDLEDFRDRTKGEFGGIGIGITYENNMIKVSSVIENLPAYKAGIKAGNYIAKVNDELVSNLGFDKAVMKMRGEPGTKVKLLVIKEDKSKPQKIELTREIVKILSVKAHLEEHNIAYIRVATFNEHTISELKQSINNLKTESKDNIQGIILDLRDNPGGLLEQAVTVSEYFIDSGIIVTTKGRTSSSNSQFVANKFVAKAPKVPVIVLINANSASAAEIVAGALKDHKRALLVGTKSFGKGSVQSLTQINPRAAVKLTTAKYYTPNGCSIQAEGIEADIVIELAQVKYSKSKKNDQRSSESSLKNYLKNDQQKNETKKIAIPPEKGSIEDTKLKNDKTEKSQLSRFYERDYQFARAYDIMVGIIFYKKLIN